MFIPWKERSRYNEDPLFYTSQTLPKLGAWGRYWYQKWHGARGWTVDGHMLAAYDIAHHHTIQSFSDTNSLPLFKSTWGCHYVILCQQYTLFKKLTPEMYGFAQRSFINWVNHQDYYWQYDIPQSYEAFSHSIILYDYYYENVKDYIEHWEIHRWNMVLAGKPSITYARAIPDSWWDIVLSPGLYETDLPHGLLIKNAVIEENVLKWMELLIPLHGHDKVFHLLKILNQREPIKEMKEFFEKVLHTIGSEYYHLEYELHGSIKWLRSNTWSNTMTSQSDTECELLI